MLRQSIAAAEVEIGEKKRADVHVVEEEEMREEDVVEEKESSVACRRGATAKAVDGGRTEASSHHGDKDGHTDSDAGAGMDVKDDHATKPAVSSQPSTYSQNTVIMFDWDDTLLASSFLSARGYRVDCVESPAVLSDPSDAAQLRAQEQCVVALLTLALSYGTVNIVTNAETGWVELSAQKFMPAVLPLLSRVNVLSARSTFEPAYPEAPLKWKYYAFHERLRSTFGDGCMDARAAEADITSLPAGDMKKNIVSFGDSLWNARPFVLLPGACPVGAASP